MIKKTILIVEDDGVLAMDLQDTLTRLGYTVLNAVATGEMAISEVEKHRPDLILMDIELAGEMNGIMAAGQISKVSDAPVIYLTGYSHDPLLQQAKITEPYAYLIKPVPERELASAIEISLYRHMLDKRLRESENKFRALFMNMIEGAALHELTYNDQGIPEDYVIIEINPAFEMQLGITRDSVIGKTSREAYGVPEPPYLDIYARVALSGKPEVFETYFPPLAKHFSISAYCPYTGCFATVFEDISERTKQDQLIIQSEKRFEATFYSSPQATAITDPLSGRLLEVNNEFVNWSGYSREGLIGHTTKELNIWVDLDERAHIMRRIRSGGLVDKEKVTFRTRQGEPRQMLFSARIIEVDGKELLISHAQDITELKRAEEEIRKSDMRFKAQYHGSPTPTFTWRKLGDDFVLEDYNNAADIVTEGSVSQFIGKTAREMYHDLGDILQDLQRCFDERSVIKKELQSTHFMPGRIFVATYAFVPHDLIMVHLEDITENRKAEEKAKTQMEFVTTLLDTIPNPVFYKDTSGKYLGCNRAFEEFLGDCRENIIDKDVRDLSPAHIAEKYEAMDNELFKHGGRQTYEWKVRSADGIEKDVIFNKAAFTDAGGTITGLVGVIIDITERKRSEEALRLSENKYRQLYQSMRDAYASVDMDGYIKDCNESFLYMLGYGPQEISTLTHNDITPMKWHAMEADIIEQQVLQRGYSDLYEKEYQRKDGTIFPVELRAVLLTDNSGVPTGMWAIIRDITERKQAEETLREREMQYRQLIDQAADGIFLTDAGGKFQLVNSKFCELLGYTEEELYHHTILDTYPEESRDIGSKRLAFLQSGESLRFERPMKRKDGSLFIVEASASKLHDGRLQAIVHDITERKKVEDALKNSEARLRLAQEAAKVGTWEWDITTNENFWSEEVWTLYGLEPFSCKPSYEAWRQTIHPDDRVKAENAVNEAAANRIELNAEWRVQYGDGSERWLMSRGKPVLSSDGKLLRYSGIVMDITERKQAEEETRIMAKRLSLATDAASIGIWEWDLEKDQWYATPTYSTMLGYEPEKSFSNRDVWIKRVHPEDSDAVSEKIRKVLAGSDEPYQYEARMLHADGSYRWISVIGRVLNLDKQGKANRMIGVRMDITERKQAEEERQRIEAQLLQSQKMEAIGQLAGGVAHDLNNLLTPILGYSEMLLEELHVDDPRRKDISLIEQAAESAKTLTRQLLAFSRKQVLDMKPVDLSRVLTDFKKIIRRTIREDIDIRIQPNAASVFVKADVGQIEQIIMNLAVNAQDAMPGGGILTLATEEMTLDDTYLAAHPEAIPGRYVVLDVSDTGEGMDNELMEHIFEPFFTTKETGKGTGLGLSTVYGIVKQHSGFINVYSEPGNGSRFSIYLPRSGDVSEKREEKPKQKILRQESEGNETVVIAEDNDLVRDLAGDILRKRGYMVISAKDGRECLEILADYDDKIDLLLTDVIMPDMNGKELYDNLSKIRPGLPVIYMSGYTEDVIAHHGVLEKGVDLIHKPFTRKSLTEKVREVLDR